MAALILAFCLCGNLCACGGQSTTTETPPTEPTKETIILTPENVQDYLWIEYETANYKAGKEFNQSLGYMFCYAYIDCIIQIDKKVPCELSNVKLTLNVIPAGWYQDGKTFEIQLPADGKATKELNFSASAAFSEPKNFVIEVVSVSGSVEIGK